MHGFGMVAVTINDEDMELDKPFTMNFPTVNISFHPFTAGVGEMVDINSDLFTFVAMGVRAFTDNISGYNR